MGQPSYPKRRGKRFPLSCLLDYRTLDTCLDQEISGRGRTVDISSTGVLFMASRELSLGQMVKLSIVWPLLRCGCVPVTLAVVGQVIRTDAETVAIEMRWRDFIADPVAALQAQTAGVPEWVM